MFRLTLMTLAMSTALAAAADKKYWVFFGTGTTGKSKSQGLYSSEFDATTGKLSEPKPVAKVKNPTFIAIHPNSKFLYCIGEVDTIGGKKAGGVHAFSIDASNGTLTKLNDSDSGSPGPAHVNVDPSGQCLIVSNYGSGSVKCLKLDDDGSIGKDSSFHQHTGSSVNPARQKEPHVHSGHVSPDGRFAVLVDLGLDKLMVYKLDPKTAKLTPNDPAFFATHPGAGPRHFAWHPNGKWAYTNGELDATVTAMSYDPKAGTFTKLNVCPTLPADVADDVKAKNSTAEIVAHPDGKTVFVSNRGHNSIATFQVSEDGSLTPGPHLMSPDIKTPRNFNLDPTGQWILIANQDGDSIAKFKWNAAAGTGEDMHELVRIPKPMCIRFVERK